MEPDTVGKKGSFLTYTVGTTSEVVVSTRERALLPLISPIPSTLGCEVGTQGVPSSKASTEEGAFGRRTDRGTVSFCTDGTKVF